jgi:hypothetical protein
MQFRSEKIPQNRLGMASVILRKKLLIPRHPRFTEESIPRLGTEENGIKKLLLQTNLLQQTDTCFCPRHASGRNSESLLLFFSTERNSEHFSPLPYRSESSESFLFRGTAKIPPEQTNCPIVSSIPSSAE